MAALDGLTRLLNRQTFETRVVDVWREATARQLTISVLMIDVDDFKRYNDHYGHLAGDDCLQRIAQAVRNAVAGNPADLLARYGGEELVAVLIDRSAADAQAAAERIVADVAALAIPHEVVEPAFGRSYRQRRKVGMLLGQQHFDQLDVDFDLAGRAIHYCRQHRPIHAAQDAGAAKSAVAMRFVCTVTFCVPVNVSVSSAVASSSPQVKATV